MKLHENSQTRFRLQCMICLHLEFEGLLQRPAPEANSAGLIRIWESPHENFSMLLLLCPFPSVFKDIYHYWMTKRPYWDVTIELVIFPLDQSFFVLGSWWSISAQPVGLDTQSIWPGNGEVTIHLFHISKCYVFTTKPGFNWFYFSKCLP